MEIREFILKSGNLDRLKNFYNGLLDFRIIKSDAKTLSVEVGTSVLSFISGVSFPTHFAFNIPAMSESIALEWLKKKVEVIPFDGEEIIDFSDWNAKAIYFRDPDGNIVEFIARRDLLTKHNGEFFAQSVMNISEVGMVCERIEDVYRQLNSFVQLPVYDGNFDKFCAAGNEEGLFILVDKKKGNWFPSNTKLKKVDFEVRGDFNFKYEQGEIIPIKNYH